VCDPDDDNDAVDDLADNCPRNANTGQQNADGDPNGDACDCNSQSATVWERPAEVPGFRATHAPPVTTLVWDPPATTGGTQPPFYDVLRSGSPSEFVVSTVCLETNDGANRTATDSTNPAAGTVFHYLVRAENACPTGPGNLGSDSNGAERPGRTCP